MVLDNNRLLEAYSSHLSTFNWDTYLTVTFKHTRHDGTNAVNAVWERLPCLPDRAFIAVEPHKLDGIHLHALLHHRNDMPVEQFNEIPGRTQAYCTKTFGWSKASFIETAGVLDYCSKYVTKGNEYFYKGDPYYWKHIT